MDKLLCRFREVQLVDPSMSFDIQTFLTAPTEELENLSWYNMISRMGLSSFNWSGTAPIQTIISTLKITSDRRVLMVGCGAGGSAIYIAEKTGAEVYGIDIAEESIRKAQEGALKSPAAFRLHFQLGDAQALPFGDNFFDIVVTEFMAFFLKPEAFHGFFRVLKSGGFLALAEIMLKDEISIAAEVKIHEAEGLYSKLTGSLFRIPKISQYHSYLQNAGFSAIEISASFPPPSINEMIIIVGGWRNLAKVLKKTLHLMKESEVIKERFLINKQIKKVLIQKRSTAKYIFQGILLAQKL